MSTNEFFQYLMTNSETEDLAAQLASAYLQRVCAPKQLPRRSRRQPPESGLCARSVNVNGTRGMPGGDVQWCLS